MPKRYWGFIAAIVGIAACYGFGLGYYHAALNYPYEEGQPQYRYAADKPADVEPTLSAMTGTQALEYRRPCHNPKGESESDLCAQWRAAKAGEDSARWAKWGFVISTIGSALLLWQIFLTRKAVEDTGEATEAMREANSIATNSQRPWISIENIVCKVCKPSHIENGQNGIAFHVAYDLVNYGNTPALSVFDMVIFSKFDELFNSYPDAYANAYARAPHSGNIIFPGQRKKINSPHAIRGIGFASSIEAIALSLVIYATYRGESGKVFMTGLHVSAFRQGSSENSMMYFNINELTDQLVESAVISQSEGNIVI